MPARSLEGSSTHLASLDTNGSVAINFDTAQGLPSLSPEQQNLLLAALQSNKRARSQLNQSQNIKPTGPRPNGLIKSQSSSDSDNMPLSRNHSDSPVSGAITFGDSLFPNFMNSNTSFDVDFPTGDVDMPNDYLTSSGDGIFEEYGDGGEKRKSPDDDEDDDAEPESGKRRESEEKVAKKPGRKLITTEPTTKRKAQNRAAQRAFRERKEKHVKDLEQKVTDLEKVSDTASQENSVLRAEIQRLHTELKDYRKRLSTGGSGLSTSPTVGGLGSLYSTQAPMSGHMSDFQFDFPRFGNTSLENTSLLPALAGNGVADTNAFTGQALTESPGARPDTNLQAFRFEPGLFGGVSTVDYSNTFEPLQSLGNTTGHAEPRENSQSSQSHSGSASSIDSPESSNGLNTASSCGTSPEPAPNYNLDGAKSFADLTYDTSALHQDQLTGVPLSQGLYDFSNIDWLSQQNGGQFNPQLFGDYRESQAAVVGDGDFSSGFFEDPYNLQDFSAASTGLNFNLADTTNTTTTQTSTPVAAPSAPEQPKGKAGSMMMEQVNKCRRGDTGHEPGTDMSQRKSELMTTHKLWSELQTCPKFLSGDLDIDALCSELSAKATCAETGMTVPKEFVEKVLWRLVGVEDASEGTGSQSSTKH